MAIAYITQLGELISAPGGGLFPCGRSEETGRTGAPAPPSSLILAADASRGTELPGRRRHTSHARRTYGTRRWLPCRPAQHEAGRAAQNRRRVFRRASGETLR